MTYVSSFFFFRLTFSRLGRTWYVLCKMAVASAVASVYTYHREGVSRRVAGRFFLFLFRRTMYRQKEELAVGIEIVGGLLR